MLPEQSPEEPRQGRPWWAVVPLLAALALYGWTLRIPFFADDVTNFWILDSNNGLDIWRGSPAYQYYRPLPFTLWKLHYHLLGGRYDAVSFHGVQLVLFGLTGMLLALVIRRLVGGRAGWLAGLLGGLAFVIFPFNYQVLGLVGALFHSLLAFCFVGCIWAALACWDGRRRAGCWLALSWIFAFCGVFSHENGLLLVPLLIGAWGVAFRGRLPLRRLAVLLSPVFLIVVVFFVLWLMVPRAGFGEDLVPAGEMDVRAAQLMQGIAYPVVAAARLLIGQDATLSTGLTLLVEVGVSWLLLGIVWRRSRRDGLVAAFGWAWYVVGVLPAVLFLDAGYVSFSARLMCLSSVGAAIFFGVSLAALWRSASPAAARWRTWLPRAAAVGLAVAMIAVSLAFILRMRTLYLRLGDYTHRLMDMGQALAIDRSELLLVNAPDYLHATPTTFLYGVERVIFLVDFIGYDRMYWLNRGMAIPAVTSVAYPPTILAEDYGAHLPFVDDDLLWDEVRDAEHIIVTRFGDGAIWPEYVGGVAVPAFEGGPLAVFPDIGVTLWGAAAYYVPDSQAVTVKTEWETGEPGPVKVFVHVYCDGAFRTQSDGFPLGDLYPFRAWSPGERRTSLRTVVLAPDMDYDCLAVYIGLYDEYTGERFLPGDLEAHPQWADGALPLPVETRPDALQSLIAPP